MFGGGLLAIPFLPNQEAVGFPTTKAAEVSQQQTDSEKLPANTEPSTTNFFTTIAQEEQQIEQPPASEEANNTSALQPIEQPPASEETNNTSALQPIEQPLDFNDDIWVGIIRTTFSF